MASGWLIFIACVLIIIVLIQVARTLDLVAQLRGTERTTQEMSRFHGILGLIFLLLGLYGFFWCFPHFENRMVDHHSSDHAMIIHRMFVVTLIITSIVFLLCNVLLFWFAYRFHYKKTRQAVHFAHSNRLEFIWTIIPTIVLTALVVFGLQAWTKITSLPTEGALVVEMTGQQFFWTSRYPGEDGMLGPRDHDLITADNPLGIVTREFIEHRKVTLTGSKKLKYTGEIEKIKDRQSQLIRMIDSLNIIAENSPNKHRVEDAHTAIGSLEDELEDLPEKIENRQKCFDRITKKYTDQYVAEHSEELNWGYDDIMPSELHLPVDKEILVKITALDVLHDLYIPHMDVKMDAVPGMPTSFKFTPRITTNEKRIEFSQNPDWQRIKEGDENPRWKNFNYEIACAELCGSGHYSMKYTLVIEDEAEYENWLSGQATKWNQVMADLKLENGPSKYAPKLVLPLPSATDTTGAVLDSTGARSATINSVRDTMR